MSFIRMGSKQQVGCAAAKARGEMPCATNPSMGMLVAGATSVT